MQPVNVFMVSSLLAPLGGSADIDSEVIKYQNLDENNEAAIREVLSKVIKPYFEKQSQQYQISAKQSLAYYLTTENVDFGELYDNCLIAFDHPSDPGTFFYGPGRSYFLMKIISWKI
jgi:hypothetical protein